MVNSSNIPSAAALAETYEKRAKVMMNLRFENITKFLAEALQKAADHGENAFILYEDDICGMKIDYIEFIILKDLLKELGFKVGRIKINDSWVAKYHMRISWHKGLDLRDILDAYK